MNIKKSSVRSVLILLLLAAALAGSLYDYTVRNERMVRANTYQTLADAAEDQITLLKTKLNDQFIHLEIMAQYAGSHGGIFDDGLRAAMDLTAKKYGFLDMGLVDASTGEAQLNDRSVFNASDRDYFTGALAGERVIGYIESGHLTGITVFALSVPVYVNGDVAAVLFASFDAAGFTGLLEATAYDGQSYSFVTDGDGEIIINSDDPSALVVEGNVLEFFGNAELSDGLAAQDIAENMGAADTLTFSFSSGRETRYASCVLMGINDWCLFYLTPAATVEKRTAESMDLMIDLVMKLAVIFVILIALLTLRERRNRREISRNAEEYRVAASHSDRIIMRYDLQAKTISYAIGHTPANSVKRTLTTGVPESTIEAGLVAEDSIPAYLGFYEAMRKGERTGTQILHMKATSDEFAWFRASYTLLGKGKTPRYAIISFYDVTREREHEMVYEKWRQSLRGRAPESYTLFCCGIGREISVDTREGELLSVNFEPGGFSFNGRTEQYVAQYVVEEDAESFAAFLNSDHLVSSYYRGDRMLVLDYREKLPEGGYRWMRLTAETVARADSLEIEAYLLFENINDTKLSELTLRRQAETDSLTGLLNRAVFEQRVDKLIRESGANAQHAMLMLDIDNFKQVNDDFGHDAGDRALIGIANALRSITRSNDLMSRLGGDEYMVFLSGISDKAAVISKAKQIRSLAHQSFSGEDLLTVSIGIAFAPSDGTDFATLYKKVDSALYYVKGSTKDGEAVYSENMSSENMSSENMSDENR